jgi:hypothetical protein
MKLATIKILYDELNADLFAGALTRPRILAKRWRSAYAQYVTPNGPTRLEFNIANIKGFSMARAVLFHEMVHQYLEEILHSNEENPHGELFWRVYTWFAIGQNIQLFEELD